MPSLIKMEIVCYWHFLQDELCASSLVFLGWIYYYYLFGHHSLSSCILLFLFVYVCGIKLPPFSWIFCHWSTTSTLSFSFLVLFCSQFLHHDCHFSFYMKNEVLLLFCCCCFQAYAFIISLTSCHKNNKEITCLFCILAFP